MKIAFIINAKRKLSTEAQEIINALRKIDEHQIHEFKTSGPRDAIVLAHQCCNNQFECIVAVGGDGTLNEVINGIKQTDQRPILGVLPNGTGNDFYRNLGVFNAKTWIKGFLENQIKEVDLLRLDQKETTSYGINIIGLGFDGHVIQILNNQRKNLGLNGRISYPTAIARAFFSYKRPNLTIKTDQYSSSGKTLLFTACNGTTFGHGLTIAPQAKISDGMIQCVHFADLTLWDYINYLKKLKKGELINHPELHYFEAKEVTINVEKGKAYCEADGEMMQEGSCKISIVPKALRVLIPA